MTFARRSLAAAGIAAAALAFAGGARLLAQDSTELKPEDLFASAKASFGEKKYGRALADLQLLVGELAKLRVEQVKPAMPPAPAGWTAEDPAGDATGMGWAAAAGITVKRDYQRPAKEEGGEPTRVSAQLLMDSPLVGMVAPWLSNPAMIQGQEGMSILNLKGKKALLEWHKNGGNGSLKILLHDNTTLLTIEGSDLQKADLADAFAKAVDVEKLEKVLAE